MNSLEAQDQNNQIGTGHRTLGVRWLQVGNGPGSWKAD
jgi:hypothetical protein